MTDKLLSISEAAKLMEVCENTLRDWDIEGKFTAERTSGGHRRYSLDKIREYLDQNQPKIQENKPLNLEIAKTVQKWQGSEYLKDLNLSNEDITILAILLDNAEKNHNQSNVTYDTLFSTSQILWLTREGWLRSKLRKVISVQPMIGPVNLVYYIVDGVYQKAVESVPIAARTKKFTFSLFDNANFDSIKEVYADAIASEIDHEIMELLPKIDIEEVLDSSLTALPIELNHVYDYIVAPKGILETLNERCCIKGIETFEIKTVLDPETFKIRAFGGRYSQHRLALPIFCPYIIIADLPTIGIVRSAIMRFGYYKG